MGGGRWNPWAELRARHHISIEWTWLAGERGQWVLHADGSVTIHLDPRLSQRERRCVLGHELIHDERRIGFTASTPQWLVESEERIVWNETSRRLVPPDQLDVFIESAAPLPLELWEISDEFDVDQKVARLACAQLRRRGRRAA